MEWQQDEDEELFRSVIDALPRLKQYRLSESQRVFIERIEKMKIVEQQAPVIE